MVAHVLTALMSCAKAKATSVSIAQRRCSFRSCHADAPLLLSAKVCGVGYDHDAPAVQSHSGLCPAAQGAEPPIPIPSPSGVPDLSGARDGGAICRGSGAHPYRDPHPRFAGDRGSLAS